ncbi:camphor resistance protein CrcB [Rhodoblastus acidophilus]|uniref:Fluoride-specific ion channel FluC n=1 Tax=Rhodoblastus acidophilus TaxID=1074 RepID=A0A212RTF9_RHOAC|nr:fluoride efflux transporter CrcB [Rhodoblastus acidophilus]PPQ37384.1 fluoride efflux transporter CrcB [Rhodoblastus acidophilus]RAI23170.1 protein CrcB [Rhodoblastus acidophilus]SNB76013.1 camphor resistance protein CrcB [Rhodoblastus acidophilus]
MQSYLIVFFGAGFGGCLRHFINLAAARTMGTGFPWGTFVINISGSLAMGLIAGFLTFREGLHGSQHLRLFLLTGILGGYTTFSAFSLDAALLYDRGDVLGMALYVAGSVALALVGVFSGLAIMRALS